MHVFLDRVTSSYINGKVPRLEDWIGYIFWNFSSLICFKYIWKSGGNEWRVMYVFLRSHITQLEPWFSGCMIWNLHRENSIPLPSCEKGSHLVRFRKIMVKQNVRQEDKMTSRWQIPAPTPSSNKVKKKKTLKEWSGSFYSIYSWANFDFSDIIPFEIFP